MNADSADQSSGIPLDGSLSVIIGGNQGIGAALAQELGRHGSRVVIAGRNERTLQETLAALQDESVVADARVMDLTDVDGVLEGCQQIIADHGTPRLLVNAAGGSLKKDALDVTPDEWDQLLDTHLRGTFFASQTMAKAMVDVGYGKVLNFSSAWASTAARGRSIYATAKAGVSHLTAALAVEWAPLGVRVNAIAPTATMTPRVQERHDSNPNAAAFSLARIPLGRIAEVSDVVNASMFLASESSDFITGQTLYVDGGWQYAK